ncbi:DUF5655 domain-containing protein [Undibacterium terreum]|uniref:DUF5655 domain-containing protein n=1 Tax=Undibacterium terreum TaxID=1224302 RepID=A0A916UYL0_9BURK|nr:DUF5655 domain-containing protein [Undibacterium terreum]GGC94271.1 hypothetical protein GCM10011396_47030 [Undibacterium terreum]
MGKVEDALATQLANIQQRTGKSLAELSKIAKNCGHTKHGEIRDYLKTTLALGHGDANSLTHYVLKADTAADASGAADGQDDTDAADALYSGPKAALRPIHDAVMARLAGFGEFEISPKKTYLSLRRKKQFAMLGPATNTRVELGLNIKSLPANARLLEQAAGGMCNYKVKLVSVEEVDAELMSWIKLAFAGAG